MVKRDFVIRVIQFSCWIVAFVCGSLSSILNFRDGDNLFGGLWAFTAILVLGNIVLQGIIVTKKGE